MQVWELGEYLREEWEEVPETWTPAYEFLWNLKPTQFWEIIFEV